MSVKNIYQVWYQGFDKIEDKKFKMNVKQWKHLNEPDGWTYYPITSVELENACSDFSQECLNAYYKFDLMHLKIDLGKLCLIYNNGGIFVDMDAYVLRPLNYNDNLQNIIYNYENYRTEMLCLSSYNVSIVEQILLSGHTFKVNNAIMFSTPRHAILKKYIEHVINNINKQNKCIHDYRLIQKTTGPLVLQAFFKKYINHDKIFIFPNEIFEPCDLSKNCKIKDSTIAIHQFELSWIKGTLKYMKDIYVVLRSYIILILCLILYNKQK